MLLYNGKGNSLHTTYYWMSFQQCLCILATEIECVLLRVCVCHCLCGTLGSMYWWRSSAIIHSLRSVKICAESFPYKNFVCHLPLETFSKKQRRFSVGITEIGTNIFNTKEMLWKSCKFKRATNMKWWD